MNDFVDKIYVSNLVRRPDKLIKLLWGFDKYKITPIPTIVPAIDGSIQEIRNKQNLIPPGAYGYLLTWKKILQDALHNNYNRILLMDDDVILCKNFNEQFKKWIKRFEEHHQANSQSQKTNWKILLLGATQHAKIPQLNEINQITQINQPNEINKPNQPNQLFYHPNKTDGSFAVIIQSRKMIQELHNMINENEPKILDSDILREVYRRWEKYCYVCLPNLIIADVGSSDIRGSRDQQQLADKVGWNLHNYEYPLKKPLVSIVIPCFNAEKTIYRTLISLVSQTYRPLEIIIVNDGSFDKSYDVICDFIYRWKYSGEEIGGEGNVYNEVNKINEVNKQTQIHWKVINNSKNLGCYASRNIGLKYVSGDIMTFHDADDISLNNRIQQQLINLLQYRVEVSSCLMLRTHLPQLPVNQTQLINKVVQERIHTDKYCCQSHFGLATCMFRTPFLKSLGKYKEDWRWGADAEMMLRVFPEAKKIEQMMNYLDKNRYIKNRHYCMNKIMYLSHEMNEGNLTSIRLKGTVENKI